MDSNVILSIISVIGTISSVIFAFLAFSRNKKQDIQDEGRKDAETAIDLASIKIDLKYTRDGIERINTKLNDTEKIQSKLSDRLARVEEHLVRTDGRLDKLENKSKKGDSYL